MVQINKTSVLFASNLESHGAVREILLLRDLSPIISVDHYITTNLHGNYRERYDLTKSSIVKNGMLNPLVVVRTTADVWQRQHQISSNSDSLTVHTQPPDDPRSPVNVVLCGCRRLHIAESLGYTHIACLVVDSFEDAGRICPKQRKNFKQLVDKAP
jgi:hypothetical protein